MFGTARIRGWAARAALAALLAWRWWRGALGFPAGGRTGCDVRWAADGPGEVAAGHRGGPLRVCLHGDIVFVRRLELPAAAIMSLRETLALVISRVTPFQADDVVWSARIAGQGAAPGTVAIDLAALPRGQGDEIAAWAAAGGFALRSLAVAAGEGEAPLELLPAARQRAGRVLRARLGAAAALALGMIMLDQAWQARLAGREAALAAAAQAMRAPAAEAAARRREREAVMRPAEIAREAAAAGTLRLLSELTARLPDDAQLVEMKRDGDAVTISGMSGDAPRLLGLIEQSPQFEGARFMAPVSRNPGDGRDFFSIRFTYREVGS